MLTFPLVLPASPVPRSLKIAANNLVAGNISPYTAESETLEWPGEWLELEASYPPLPRAQAAEIIAFLMAVRGGAFSAGDPMGLTPRGSLLTAAGNLVGPRIPGTAVDGGLVIGDPGYDLPWLNPGYATGQDQNYASTAMIYMNDGFEHITNPLKCSNFGFTLASAANVTGIKVEVFRYANYMTPGGYCHDYQIRLLYDGAPFGPDLAAIATEWPVVFYNAAWASYGGDGQLWGIPELIAGSLGGFTIADVINHAGFGVWVRSHFKGCVPSIDAVRITVYIAGSALSVNGAQVAGSRTLATKGWKANEAGVLLKCDYVQLGSGSARHLHQALTDVNADANGLATLDLFPSLREAVADNDSLVFTNTSGLWRLAEFRREWTVDYTRTYGINFKAREAI